jgi:rhamnosyltransferase subunit B
MSRVALVAFGSAGDAHPMLAAGQALAARGHEVVFLGNAAFAAEAARAGLTFQPIGREEDYRQTIAHPKLWHPIDGFGVMWRYLLRPALRPTYEALEALAARGPLRVLASPVAMGARIAQEKLGLPLLSAYTAPGMLRTVYDPMTLAQWRVAPAVPQALRRVAWRALDRFKLEPMAAPVLNEYRARLGLPAIGSSVFGHWMHSPQGGVALFPEWFAAAAPDWPAQLRHAGFPLYDGDADTGSVLALRLAEFLDAGPAPLVFMPGTAAQGRAPFYRAALEACRSLGRRGVLLGQVEPAFSAALPRELIAMPYAPFSLLLPRALALVHHGGIGSCAQALRAGIAQLVVPQAYDQFDNAMRLEHLGVGKSLGRGPRALERLPQALRELTASAAVAAACKANASRLNAGDARSRLVRLVEELA